MNAPAKVGSIVAGTGPSTARSTERSRPPTRPGRRCRRAWPPHPRCPSARPPSPRPRPTRKRRCHLRPAGSRRVRPLSARPSPTVTGSAHRSRWRGWWMRRLVHGQPGPRSRRKPHRPATRQPPWARPRPSPVLPAAADSSGQTRTNTAADVQIHTGNCASACRLQVVPGGHGPWLGIPCAPPPRLWTSCGDQVKALTRRETSLTSRR